MKNNCLNFNGIYITHAMGEIDGVAYTNSLDAFMLNYKQGQRIFEVDFDLVNDNLICCHDESTFKHFVTNHSYTYENFMKSKLLGKYTTLDIKSLNQLLCRYQDVVIVTDTKYSDFDHVNKMFNIIKTECSENLDRIIPQIYNREMYKYIKAIYPFSHVIFTLYQLEHWDAKNIASFCSQNNISMVTMWHHLLNPNIARIFHDNHIKICTHTVNDIDVVKQLKQIGCDYFYTDSIHG